MKDRIRCKYRHGPPDPRHRFCPADGVRNGLSVGAVLGSDLERLLHEDFKKQGGEQRSQELSREYGLYRQDYCGCIFSKRERDKRVSAREGGEKQQQEQ